jgi:hypothetical protein
MNKIVNTFKIIFNICGGIFLIIAGIFLINLYSCFNKQSWFETVLLLQLPILGVVAIILGIRRIFLTLKNLVNKGKLQKNE